jgi:hypothetical protein
VSGVTAATSTPAVSAPPPIQTSTTEADSLLPESEPLSTATLDDAMSALYMALSQSRDAGMRSAEQQVETQQALQEKALTDAKAAIEKQAADQKKGGFWHDLEKGAMLVAKVALAVVAVAATVVTAGAASPVLIAVALALTAGGMIVSDTKCLGKEVSPWVGLGMEVVGSVLTLGAGAGVASQTVGAQVLSKVRTVASIAATGATVVGGTAHIESAEITADSQNAAADIEQSQQQVDRLDRFIGWVVDSAKESDESHGRAEQSLEDAMATNDAAATAAVPVAVKG